MRHWIKKSEYGGAYSPVRSTAKKVESSVPARWTFCDWGSTGGSRVHSPQVGSALAGPQTGSLCPVERGSGERKEERGREGNRLKAGFWRSRWAIWWSQDFVLRAWELFISSKQSLMWLDLLYKYHEMLWGQRVAARVSLRETDYDTVKFFCVRWWLGTQWTKFRLGIYLPRNMQYKVHGGKWCCVSIKCT